MLQLAKYKELHHLVVWWTKLGEPGTSTDEEEEREDGSRVFGILRKDWRSAELERFCRFLQVLVSVDPDRRNSVVLRRRIPTGKVSMRKARRGLPINWYDPTWYNRLSAGERRRLGAQPAVPLDIPALDDL